MSESSRSQDHEPKLSATSSTSDHRLARRTVDSGRTLLVGIFGGIASAVGYAVYQRLPDEQRERLNDQARTFIASRLNEFRSTFNL